MRRRCCVAWTRAGACAACSTCRPLPHAVFARDPATCLATGWWLASRCVTMDSQRAFSICCRCCAGHWVTTLSLARCCQPRRPPSGSRGRGRALPLRGASALGSLWLRRATTAVMRVRRAMGRWRRPHPSEGGAQACVARGGRAGRHGSVQASTTRAPCGSASRRCTLPASRRLPVPSFVDAAQRAWGRSGAGVWPPWSLRWSGRRAGAWLRRVKMQRRVACPPHSHWMS